MAIKNKYVHTIHNGFEDYINNIENSEDGTFIPEEEYTNFQSQRGLSNNLKGKAFELAIVEMFNKKRKLTTGTIINNKRLIDYLPKEKWHILTDFHLLKKFKLKIESLTTSGDSIEFVKTIKNYNQKFENENYYFMACINKKMFQPDNYYRIYTWNKREVYPIDEHFICKKCHAVYLINDRYPTLNDTEKNCKKGGIGYHTMKTLKQKEDVKKAFYSEPVIVKGDEVINFLKNNKTIWEKTLLDEMQKRPDIVYSEKSDGVLSLYLIETKNNERSCLTVGSFWQVYNYLLILKMMSEEKINCKIIYSGGLSSEFKNLLSFMETKGVLLEMDDAVDFISDYQNNNDKKIVGVNVFHDNYIGKNNIDSSSFLRYGLNGNWYFELLYSDKREEKFVITLNESPDKKVSE